MGVSPVGPTQPLVDLVLNPHDSAYREAAERREASGISKRWYDGPATAVGCLLVGFTLVVGYVHTHRGEPQATKLQTSLIERVRAAERDADDLAAQADELTRQVEQARRSGLAGSTSLAESLRHEQLLAGQIAAKGPGLQVTLSDPSTHEAEPDPGRVGTEPITATNILTDRDVRSVVNELWAAGAQAISVNDVRLTPTSAVRFAGQVVLVDFEPVTSPYVIRAVGEADSLATGLASSSIASRYVTLASANGIGFSFAEQDSMTLPARAGITLHFAQSDRVPFGGTK